RVGRGVAALGPARRGELEQEARAEAAVADLAVVEEAEADRGPRDRGQVSAQDELVELVGIDALARVPGAERVDDAARAAVARRGVVGGGPGLAGEDRHEHERGADRAVERALARRAGLARAAQARPGADPGGGPRRR